MADEPLFTPRRCECGQYPDVCKRYGHRSDYEQTPDEASEPLFPTRGGECVCDREYVVSCPYKWCPETGHPEAGEPASEPLFPTRREIPS